jgi:peroxiredoxin
MIFQFLYSRPTPCNLFLSCFSLLLLMMTAFWVTPEVVWAQSSTSSETSSQTPVLESFIKPPKVGSLAPRFLASDALGKDVSLKQFLGKKNVVIIFYSGNSCPVCGHQLENIQSHLKDFNTQEAQVLAISADAAEQAKMTLGEHGLSFSVIPDPQRKLIKQFGVMNLKKHNKAWPSAFIIDKKGIVRMSYADASGKRLHSSDILPELSKITKKPAPKLDYED